MSRPDYIPNPDAEFLAWMNNFISVLNANLATFGLVAADLTPLTNARNDFQTKLGNFQTAEAAFRAASEAKKTSRNAAEPLFRQMAQRINRHPAMTNALRAQLRLTVPKPRQRRGVGPEIPGVRLEVDAGRVVVHFGTNPDDERRNGKAAWALGANIYIKAEDEADYRLLAFDTASPYVWEYRGAGPEIPGVRLEVDAGCVVVHFGTNPDDERRNGKPDWAIGANKCLCVGFSTCPPPNLPRGRGRSRDSLPARGEGWGGGDV